MKKDKIKREKKNQEVRKGGKKESMEIKNNNRSKKATRKRASSYVLSRVPKETPRARLRGGGMREDQEEVPERERKREGCRGESQRKAF